MENGSVDLALQPWLFNPSVDHPSVGKLFELNYRMGVFSWPVGKARLSGIYEKADGSRTFVFEGSDGSSMPGTPIRGGRIGLPLYFPFFEPTPQLKQLRRK